MTLNEDLSKLSNSNISQRLDCALVNRGLAESRTTAQRLIRAGVVSVTIEILRNPHF